ncbi:MAG: TonB family protein [Pseudomonadales bacterium]|tara:strand:- start:624 stop:1454 length:831 start_codon:yes stop_codon:yes gene_type:complete
MSSDNSLNDTLNAAERSVPSSPRVWLMPLSATLLLHAGAAGLIYLGWQPAPPPAPEASRSIKTQLVMMPPQAAPTPEPTPIVESTPEPVPVKPLPEPVVQTPAVPRPAPKPTPQVSKPDLAAIARKEREQQQRELTQQREDQRAAAEAQQVAQQARQRAAEQMAEQQRAQLAAAAAEKAEIRSYAPINKSAPDYPRRALSRQLEGDCTVEYTVLQNGQVKDPRIVPGACEEQIFVRPSLAAAKDFIYKPRMINGQAVSVPGVRNTFRYRMETVSRP